MTNKKIKILLVEDEKDAVESITNVLKRRDFDVRSTGSGKRAIEIFQKSPFDLVLLDLDLEDITGIEVLENIRALDKRLKVIIVTGSILMVDDREKVSALGVHKFLSKPSSSEQLISSIEYTLGHDKYLALSDFPVWQFEPQKALNSRHELKGMLGVLNMQCENFLLDIECSDGDSKSFDVVLDQFKEVHGKIKKICNVVNREILP